MSDSLADIFYNTIPGVLLLVALVFIFRDTTIIANLFKIIEQLDNTILAIIFIAISLLIGFTLQTASSYFRKKICCLDEKGFSKVAEENKENYGAAKRYLSRLLRRDKPEEVFHTMDNYIRAHINDDLIKTFNARMSFWSNITLDAFIILVISILFQRDTIMIVGSLILFLVSLFGYRENFRRTYDTVLKTFWLTMKIDKKVKNNFRPL